jgi:hypothetical protein
LKIFDSTSLSGNLSGRLTPSNNRLPSPATIGPTTKRYSSTRPSSISCEGTLTPPVKIFLPCSCFNLSTSSRRFVRTILVFLSSALSSVREKRLWRWSQMLSQSRLMLLSSTGFLRLRAKTEPSIHRSYTPSREKCSSTIIFLIRRFLHLLQARGRKEAHAPRPSHRM